MGKVMKTMDGNEAAAYISYAFTEVATIYPITPSSPMAEHVDLWSAKGKKNLFGQTVRLVEMQSEAGAIGAMHGSLEAGTLTTSYTASQGLLLMIPTMYRLSGQLKPGVLHVTARTVGTHAFSIFGDHSDVMACRQTGFAMLSTGSVQEVMDLAGIAHLAAIESSVPFMHFFDGFRTSHEIQKVECIDYKDLSSMLNEEALEDFRKNSLNPERPVMRSGVENSDVFFQAREASNPYYDRLPSIVENYMNKINKLTGRNYKLFNYYGAEDAKYIIVAMGSVSGAIQETVDALNKQGQKTGYLQVHLYRPFSLEHFLKDLPRTVKKVTVLDRTKEPGALGEPLYLDVCSAFIDKAVRPQIFAGRYGLSSKDVTPAQIVAVYNNMIKDEPKNHFTVGIHDDLTYLSLTVGEELDLAAEGTISCKFWGLGSDGTVGANKNSIKIIGDHTDLYVQAYFEYDTKKSGGITKSHLRFGKTPIRSSYYVKTADFVACHNPSYIDKYDIVSDIKDNGIFLLNCSWKGNELEESLSASVKRALAKKNIQFYIIDATHIAKEIGLGSRTNTILQAAFFKLAKVIPVPQAVEYMKAAILKSYGQKGEKVIHMNNAAVDQGVIGAEKVKVPASWLDAVDTVVAANKDLPDFVKNIMIPINAQKGDDIPVSAFAARADGTFPLGTSAYDKRGIALDVPEWIADNCIQCNQCSFVCPHAAIRPFLVTEEETAAAPQGYKTKKANGGPSFGKYNYRMQVDVLDCYGCGSCVQVCPAKEKALAMKPLASQKAEIENWDYSLKLSHKENPLDKFSVKGSQFEQPLLEFSGACAGCGETPYMKLMTQLYGDRMYVANATGCTQAWGAAAPCFPYTVNKDGHGPAWSNSLFENNAEFSLGMCLAVQQQRQRLAMKLEELSTLTKDDILKTAISKWLENIDQGSVSKVVSNSLVKALESADLSDEDLALKEYVLNNKEHLVKKSLWMYGGDGWAYDIGYGGLDHVLASREDVNILVVDTEVYSNTGGQSSKATPIGAVAQFASSGKKIQKKDLGMLAMTYGYVYVAQVAMGANQSQLVKALQEAEQFKGPSLVIAYAPCISHGLTKGMGCTQLESKNAVEAGYWHLYRYNPMLKEEGKNPFILDSKEPKANFRDFLMGEVRYSSLVINFPGEAEELFTAAEKAAREKYEAYKEMAAKK
ncbi:pyruvate:ferredoxin (flavodoxin) oxidoreductase [Pelosinus fermentans]|uniref:Pyruvate ferredoxin/flavodoxin oxidoreductase n=1 Tax=Pelosinus fermentans JBW45 TaxID=1192197 RepID=I8TUR5_9FIRM|nr:pyruvate:ferredoxin (flavodoxin) oxidoreductase [Pelosinus fermentans]AJQ26666.1 pyruvate ferredoxin/flavodoxin oxidoreductase [Pelosinus fermentans JBW45]